MPDKYTIVTTLLRIAVLIVTVVLCILMFERGGWWILAGLVWLPVNFAVAAEFGDAKSTSSSDSAETTNFGDR